ncbi:endonuclease/exonuclease/phosphatase family domain-containing protein 1-like isoform X2 [Narcine bancroftii]|uniref:endonuclease/exonuclease/phosphatase family domain-containing protein 1-like isoform X2 n=1 Tax=Narcine bancroftii TaxID=1343680 RepID=UPI003831AC38
MGYPLSRHRPQRDSEGWNLKGRKRQKEQLASSPDIQAGNLVNINTAAEEELMTLPGINRVLAHNMVLHRNKIGGFRKIEDVALVTGVGATKLQQMKSEICVGESDNFPSVDKCSDSVDNRSPSMDNRSYSVDNLSHIDLLSCTTLNINLASEKQLMAMLGVSKDLARRIIRHRPYRCADDLVRVTGHHAFSLTPINSKLSAALPRPSFRLQQSNVPSFCSLQDLSLNPGLRPRTPSLHTLQAPFTGSFGGRRVIRVGTWNLQGLGLDKINNPGVREVICVTLLEQGIKLLAIQEVLNEDALDQLCLEFEKPTVTSLQEWKADRGIWKYVILESPSGQEEKDIERVAFLWDSSTGLKLNQAVNLEVLLEQDNTYQPYHQPVLAYFKMGELPLNLINIHLKANHSSGVPTGISNRHLDMAALQPHLTEQKQFIILGHFGLQPDASEFNILRKSHFQHCVPSDTFTNISSRSQNGDVCQDNIWFNRMSQAAYTGRWGVIRQGLSSPWIPDGWKWGGVVSQHCPVWIELFVD